MKLPHRIADSRIGGANRRASGFTLPEFMITTAVSVLVMAGIIACHLMGLRMFEMTKAKLGASDDARRSINHLIAEVRSAKSVRVGSGTVNAFTPVTGTDLQSGNSIEVYPTTNTSHWVRYYWDSSDQKLKRVTNGTESATIVASFVTNSTVFSIEDYLGNVRTNNLEDYVVGLNLQFYQLQYASVSNGPGSRFDYYQLQTRVTPRAK